MGSSMPLCWDFRRLRQRPSNPFPDALLLLPLLASWLEKDEAGANMDTGEAKGMASTLIEAESSCGPEICFV